jgi:hypothetical protein
VKAVERGFFLSEIFRDFFVYVLGCFFDLGLGSVAG